MSILIFIQLLQSLHAELSHLRKITSCSLRNKKIEWVVSWMEEQPIQPFIQYLMFPIWSSLLLSRQLTITISKEEGCRNAAACSYIQFCLLQLPGFTQGLTCMDSCCLSACPLLRLFGCRIVSIPRGISSQVRRRRRRHRISYWGPTHKIQSVFNQSRVSVDYYC